MSDTMHDLIIIGGGPGGLTAGIYAMRAAMQTLLLERGVAGGQLNNTDLIENWPGTVQISGAELAEQMAAHAASYGLATRNIGVREVEPGIDHHAVRLENGEELRAHAVILATGGSPRRLGVPGEDENYGKGVSYCAVCDGFFFREKTVVVVGGGDAALEESLFLAKIAKKVYIVHRRDAFRAGMILQKRVQAEPRIEIVWNTVVVSVNAGPEGVNGVRLKNTVDGGERELATDGLFIFIGFSPNNGLVPAGTKMNAEGFVITDSKCETTTPGIFAIGDLREKYVKQVVTAAADGCIAAQAAAHYVENRKQGGR